MTLLDTNVLIEILKNNQSSIRRVSLLMPPLAISAITVMELIYGARNKREVSMLEEFVAKFELIHMDADISTLACQLVTEYSKSHSLDIPDALIAATAIHNRMELMTYCSKDFRFIPSLKLSQVREDVRD